MKVLVVENECRLRQTLLEVLEYEGIETIDAENDHAAIQLTQKYHPDLILYASEYIGMDDGNVLSKFLHESSASAIPIIYLFSDLSMEEVQELAPADAENCLTMPFRLEELLAAIHERVNKPTKSSPEKCALKVEGSQGPHHIMIPSNVVQ